MLCFSLNHFQESTRPLKSTLSIQKRIQRLQNALPETNSINTKQDKQNFLAIKAISWLNHHRFNESKKASDWDVAIEDIVILLERVICNNNQEA